MRSSGRGTSRKSGDAQKRAALRERYSLEADGDYVDFENVLERAGPRSFSRKSSFDNVVVIMLGAIAARGVVGASPFASTVAASVVVVAIHRLIGRLCVTQHWLSKLIEGERVPLYVAGALLRDNLKRAGISEADLLESHRCCRGVRYRVRATSGCAKTRE